MKNLYPDVRGAVIRVAVITLFAGLPGITACGGEAAGPESGLELIPAKPHFVIQDENLVPNQLWSNPGNWDPSVLWTQVDEDTPNDDTDYINKYRTGLPPTNSAVTLELTDPVGDRPDTSQVHTLKVRWKVVGSYDTSTPQPTLLSYKLLEGDNVIAAGTASPSSSYVTASTVLLQSEVNSIVDYRALRIKLEAQLKPVGSAQVEARVTWTRLEIR